MYSSLACYFRSLSTEKSIIEVRYGKKTSLQVIPNERGKSFRIDLKSSRISNEYKFEIFSSYILGVQVVPAFCGFWFQRAIMNSEDCF